MSRVLLGFVVTLTLFKAPQSWAIEALDELKPGSYWGQWGSRVATAAIFEVQSAGQGVISGKVRMHEKSDQVEPGDVFDFLLEKDDEGAWHFTFDNPAVEVFKVEPVRPYLTPQGLMVSSFYQTNEPDLSTAGFFINPDLERHPKGFPRESLDIKGSLRVEATVFKAGDGLASNAARCGLQASDGHVWIGTVNGLSRFDGIEWKTFTPATHGLPDENITGLIEDAAGRLVMTTKHSGMFFIEDQGKRFVPFEVNAALLGRWLGQPSLDSEGALWVVADRRHVARISPDGGLQWWGLDDLEFAFSPSREWADWISLHPVSGGRVQVSSTRGVLIFDPDAHSVFVPSGYASGGAQLGVAGDSWTHMTWGTITVSEDEWRTARAYEFPQDHEPLKRVDPDEDGRLWVLGEKGLLHFDPRTQRLLEVENCPPEVSRSINQTFVDSEGALWVVTASNGVARLERQFVTWVAYAKDHEGVPWQPATVVPEGEGVHVAANMQVDVWEKGEEIEAYRPSRLGNLRGHLRYMGLAEKAQEANDSFPWTGLIYNPPAFEAPETPRVPVLVRGRVGTETYQEISHPEFPRGLQDIASMTETEESVWIANESGVYLYHKGKGTWSDWHDLHGLPAGPVNVLSRSDSGGVWVGTEHEGLYFERLDQSLEHYTKGDGLGSNTVLSILEADGAVWVGSRNGFSCLDPVAGEATVFRQGPFEDLATTAMVDDRLGRLWLGSHDGVYVVAKAELERLQIEPSREPRLARISYHDGLENETVYGRFFPAACRGEDGLLYFCLEGSMACFDPHWTPHFEVGPRVRVLGAYGWDDRPLPLGQPFEASAQKGLYFELTSVGYTHPEETQHWYRLPGYSDEWKSIRSQRQIWLPEIGPGDYRLEVKGYNARGTVSPDTAVMAFTVRPFYYQTWWFRLGVVALLVGLAWIIHRYRLGWRLQTTALEKQLALEEERSRIARDMHDEMGTALAQILMLGQLAEKDASSGAPGAGRISTLAKHCSQSLREIIWSLHPENNHFDDLEDYLRHHVDQTLADSGVRPVYRFAHEGPNIEFSPAVKRQVVLVLKGILSNVLKHAKATEFELELTVNEHELRLETRDDGKGFDPEEVAPDTLGLTAMRERAEKLGGEIRIETAPGRGCRTLLTLPL